MTTIVPLTPERAGGLLRAFAGQRVVVVGDMVLDEYIFGTPARISREAPVVVLEFTERRLVPGGATNVAVNLRALGAQVRVVGAVGDDIAGRELTARLERLGIAVEGLVMDPERPTSTKTRIVSGGAQVVQQQMVRIDRLDAHPLHGAARDQVLRAAGAALAGATAVLLSDYELGVIDPALIDLCLTRAREGGLVSTVDAHGDLFRFQGVTLVTPNQPEAEAAVGRPMPGSDALRDGGRRLLNGMAAHGLMITRGSLGMAVLDEEGLFVELPAFQVAEVRDVTGAGDTVAAIATLALGAGATVLESAQLATVAAGLVVRRMGAATASPDELLAALARSTGT